MLATNRERKRSVAESPKRKEAELPKHHKSFGDAPNTKSITFPKEVEVYGEQVRTQYVPKPQQLMNDTTKKSAVENMVPSIAKSNPTPPSLPKTRPKSLNGVLQRHKTVTRARGEVVDDVDQLSFGEPLLPVVKETPPAFTLAPLSPTAPMVPRRPFRKNSGAKAVAAAAHNSRRTLLPRSASSPSIRAAANGGNVQDSPRTRLRKASAPPKPSGPALYSSPQTRATTAEGFSSGRATTVKSASLRDFSLRETLHMYQKSTSPKKSGNTGEEAALKEVSATEARQKYENALVAASGEDAGGESSYRRRPSLIASISLKGVSLKDSLTVYQSKSSKTLVQSLKLEHQQPSVTE
jgi:hypothetical protein